MLEDGAQPPELLHGIFAFSTKREWATKNLWPWSTGHVRSYAHRRIRFLQPEEFEALIRAMPDDFVGAVERRL